MAVAQAAAVKASQLLTDETLLRVMATVLPDFDVEAELAALQAGEAERMDMALRIAGNAAVPAADDEDNSDEDSPDSTSDNK